MEHNGTVANSQKCPDSSPSNQLNSSSQKKMAWANLTAQYLDDLPRQLNEIKNALEKGDFLAIRKHAHRIKGTSATYKLNSISANFSQLESLAENQNLQEIVAIINKIMQLVETENNRLKSQKVSGDKDPRKNSNG